MSGCKMMPTKEMPREGFVIFWYNTLIYSNLKKAVPNCKKVVSGQRHYLLERVAANADLFLAYNRAIHSAEEKQKKAAGQRMELPERVK